MDLGVEVGPTLGIKVKTGVITSKSQYILKGVSEEEKGSN